MQRPLKNMQRGPESKFRKSRIKLGITQKELAEKAKCGIMTVVRLENSGNLPRDYEIRERLKKILGA